jgi:hypothetical protein
MDGRLEFVSCALRDEYLFPALQAVVFGAVAVSFFMELLARLRAGRGGIFMVITRAESSMSMFYGSYAVASGLVVAISLEAAPAEDHRVFWAVADAVAMAYVFILNGWARNKLLGWAHWLRTLERR